MTRTADLQHACCRRSARACSGARAHARSSQSSACSTAFCGHPSVHPSDRLNSHPSVCPPTHPSQPRGLPPAGLLPLPARLPSAAGCTGNPGQNKYSFSAGLFLTLGPFPSPGYQTPALPARRAGVPSSCQQSEGRPLPLGLLAEGISADPRPKPLPAARGGSHAAGHPG